MNNKGEWSVQRQIFLAPPPGALGRGQKVKYHLIQLQSQFHRFLYQTL